MTGSCSSWGPKHLKIKIRDVPIVSYHMQWYVCDTPRNVHCELLTARSFFPTTSFAHLISCKQNETPGWWSHDNRQSFTFAKCLLTLSFGGNYTCEVIQNWTFTLNPAKRSAPHSQPVMSGHLMSKSVPNTAGDGAAKRWEALWSKECSPFIL